MSDRERLRLQAKAGTWIIPLYRCVQVGRRSTAGACPRRHRQPEGARPSDVETMPLLLCRSKNKMVAGHSLRDLKKPVDVAQWETQIVESVPEEFKGSLPTVEEIEGELSDVE